jgi:hypothetical protein
MHNGTVNEVACFVPARDPDADIFSIIARDKIIDIPGHNRVVAERYRTGETLPDNTWGCIRPLRGDRQIKLTGNGLQ